MTIMTFFLQHTGIFVRPVGRVGRLQICVIIGFYLFPFLNLEAKL